jgi:hypothetical protein
MGPPVVVATDAIAGPGGWPTIAKAASAAAKAASAAAAEETSAEAAAATAKETKVSRIAAEAAAETAIRQPEPDECDLPAICASHAAGPCSRGASSKSS